jgi:hypothetical protein
MKIIEQIGDYSVRDERDPAQSTPFYSYGAVTLWGPDVNGRICRMGNYRNDTGRALQVLRMLAGAPS